MGQRVHGEDLKKNNYLYIQAHNPLILRHSLSLVSFLKLGVLMLAL